MFRLLLAGLFAALAVGYVTGGRLGNLADARFRLPWLGLAGVALQFVPVEGRPGDLLLAVSLVLLMVVAGVNRRLPGFALILVGLGMNFLVITANQGMPVSREAIVASGQADTLDDLRKADDPKHHLMSPDDRLVVLADVIAIPRPIRQAVSLGDLAALAGTMWFVIGAMHRVPEGRERAPVGETRPAQSGSSATGTEPAGTL